MTNSKNTKRALLASVLSVVVCCAMLIGSTFAWFTDSVTSGKNIIKAGNLDVEMYWAEGKESLDSAGWKDASENAIFDYELWEPGFVQARHIKISNKGSLALRYEIRITAIGEVNERFADVIDVYYIKDGKQLENRTELTEKDKIGTLKDVLAKPYAAKGHILAGENAVDVATIALKMQETAGNEFMNASIGSEFAVKLVATQYTAESDNFGPDYDKDADFTATYRVTPENIGEYLSGQHGSMSDAKLILAPGNYGTLQIGTLTADSKDDTVYICPDGAGHSKKSLTFTDIDEFKAHFKPGEWHGRSSYIRTIENLTIVAEDGVNVEGLSISSGHIYDTQDPINTVQGGYYLTQKLSNINFVGINFTDKVNINTSHADTVIDGVTFDGCSFTTNGITSANGQALRYYNEANNGKVKNLTVKNCTFNNCYQGIYTAHINGISVTGCTFDTTGHNAIAIQSQSVTDHKAVVIENNIFKNINDRIIRFNGVGADTQITIKNNTATNSGDGDGEVIKAQSLADGITYDISGNDWGESRKVANPEFNDRPIYPDDVTDESFTAHEGAIAVDGNGNYYTTFAEALTAGGTIYFKEDAAVNFPTHSNVLKDTTIYANGADFSGKDISIGTYAAPETNEVSLAIYNAKNLTVWGQPTDRGNVWNVTMISCKNDGYGLLMYRSGNASADKIHFTAKNCKTDGYGDSIVHTTADGSITITNCRFSNNCAPVNIAHKSAGIMDVLVEDCTFNACGKVDQKNDYFAPARFVNNKRDTTLNISLKNNTFIDTIGTNGDILLGDYRALQQYQSFDLTCEIVTKQSVMVKSSKEAPYSYNGGTIEIKK